MPLFEIRLQASLEGVALVRPGADHLLRVRFSCGKCRTVSDKLSVFSSTDEVDVGGGGTPVHALQRCKECSSSGSAVVLPLRPPATGALSAAEAEARKTAVVYLLECRGLVPVEAQPGPGWSVQGPSGVIWEADLGEDFSEYDEESDTACTVLDAKLEVQAVR